MHVCKSSLYEGLLQKAEPLNQPLAPLLQRVRSKPEEAPVSINNDSIRKKLVDMTSPRTTLNSKTAGL